VTTTVITPNILDVEQFFTELIASYTLLYKRINVFADNLADYNVSEIASECKKIKSQQENLALRDQELINILDLAGDELACELLVQDYRYAFIRTTSACDNLSKNLLILKSTLSVH
jgi:hypothetical protein